MKKKILSFLFVAMILLSMTAITAFASTLEDGAYTVSLQTSYVNPETGSTVDGGTNIALGDSMCASIVEDHLLVEQTNGKTYVTIGIGLMSNIENVRIQVQDENGTYHEAAITLTGSCQRTGDTCNHYRFEVFSADGYISPIIYVTPMGRDVQFFVLPDISSAQAGTGNFVSEMVQKTPNTTTSDTNQATESEEVPTTSESAQTEPSQTEISDSQESTDNSETSGNTEVSSNTDIKDSTQEDIEHISGDDTDGSNNVAGWVIGGIAVLVVAGVCAWYFCFFKKKR